MRPLLLTLTLCAPALATAADVDAATRHGISQQRYEDLSKQVIAGELTWEAFIERVGVEAAQAAAAQTEGNDPPPAVVAVAE